MLYLYLDESGDLGFDFVNKKPSAFFTICALVIKGRDNDKALANAVKSIVRRKIFPKQRKDSPELKGSALPIGIKKYFFSKVRGVDFKLHAATLDKKKVCFSPIADKERIYNYLARMALERVDFRDAAVRVIMTVDKRAHRRGIAEFNDYILSQVKALLDPQVPLDIFHVHSHESPGLQAVDMFAWGFYRKYERGDREWYDVFREKTRCDRLYRGKKEEERAGQAHRPGS